MDRRGSGVVRGDAHSASSGGPCGGSGERAGIGITDGLYLEFIGRASVQSVQRVDDIVDAGHFGPYVRANWTPKQIVRGAARRIPPEHAETQAGVVHMKAGW